MKLIQYLTSKEHGCCSTSELLQLSKSDKAEGTTNVETLKTWAKEEMQSRGIEITE